MTLTLHKSQFTVLVSCSHQIAVHLIRSFRYKCRLRKAGANRSTIAFVASQEHGNISFKDSLQVTCYVTAERRRLGR